MLPTIQFGPLTAQTPGLIILLGIWIGLTIAERQSERFGIKANDLDQIVFTSLLIGVITARMAYVAAHLPAFSSNWLDIFSINPQLLNSWGGIVGFFLSALIVAQRKKLSLPQLADALSPAAAFFLIILPLSNLASGNAYGEPSNLPWSIDLWGAQRHPSQLYEALAALIIFITMFVVAPKRWNPKAGLTTSIFLASTFTARLFLEAFRAESTVLLGNIRAIEVFAWVGLSLSLFMIYRIRFKTYPKGETHAGE